MVSSSGTWTTVLLWFASSWVSDQEGSVILKQELLDLSFLSFVNEFLIVSDNSFGDGLSDSIDLSNITTSSDWNSNVEVLESFKSQKKDWLHDFNSQWSGFKQFNGWSIDSQDSLSVSYWGVGNSVFLSSETLNKLILWLWHCYGGE